MSWQLDYQTRALVVDERKELAVDPDAGSAHDRALDGTWIIALQIADKLPEEIAADPTFVPAHVILDPESASVR